MHRNKLTRREFMKKSATTAAAGLALPSIFTSNALGSGAVPPASERVALGHIAMGGRGNWLLNQFLSLPQVQSVAVCDAFESRRKAAANRPLR